MKASGRLRDMVQNHMLQVFCLTAMEPPYSLAPNVVRDGKIGRPSLLAAPPVTNDDRQLRSFAPSTSTATS